MALKENYKDDILDVSVNTKRKYRMTENQDGTVSFDDETVYTQEGDSFGASDMNATNGKVNTLESDIGEINDNLTDGIGGTTDKFRFGTDGNGNYGYIKKVEGADTFFPFSKLEAVNPSRNNQPYEVPTLRLYRGKYTINVFGYKKLYLMFSRNVTIPNSILSSVTFYDKDAQSISTLSFSATANTWTNSFDIPKNAMYLVFDLNNTWDTYITWSLEP